ncbi:hypothetical protein LXL04_035627 [Taraxacum kok-saghyz]
MAAKKSSNEGVLSRVSSSISESPIVYKGKQAASDAGFVVKKLLKSTGKAAWIAGTTFLILVVPLIIEMDREAQLNELDLQQAKGLETEAMGGEKELGVFSCEVGLIQKGLIFLLRHIFHRFLQVAAAGGAEAAVVGLAGGVFWIGGKEDVGVLEWRLRR